MFLVLKHSPLFMYLFINDLVDYFIFVYICKGDYKMFVYIMFFLLIVEIVALVGLSIYSKIKIKRLERSEVNEK